MGDKLSAKEIALACGVPIIPGCTEPLRDAEDAVEKAVSFGFPDFEGGGWRRSWDAPLRQPEEVRTAYELVHSEAEKAFGCGDIFMEKYLVEPKHIEVQILADQYGNVYHLGERTAPSQRRYQKVVEFAPAWSVPQETVEALRRDAVKIARSVGVRQCRYGGVSGGPERRLLLHRDEPPIQVEHTVTEMVTGVDIVRSQILIAAGYPLSHPEIGLNRQGRTCTSTATPSSAA